MFPEQVLNWDWGGMIWAGNIRFKGPGWLKNNSAILGEGSVVQVALGLQRHTSLFLGSELQYL